MAGTWLGSKSVTFFFAQNFRILARKSVFWTPDFVNGPFVALGVSFDLPPSDPFLNFSFPSYGNFREGDPPTQQKVLPHLTVGALTDSNSPSARSALALRARALRARAGKTDLSGCQIQKNQTFQIICPFFLKFSNHYMTRKYIYIVAKL